MSGLSYFRKDNPCPICESHDGRCRQTDAGLILCMSLTDAIAIPGYRYTGRSKDGQWGLWALDDRPQNGADHERWRERLEAQRQARGFAEAQRRATAMPPDERDRYNRAILAQLALHPDDRADLHRRGFTDERIAAIGFKSVEQWQQLDQDFPANLPGVIRDGHTLNVASPGYLCPVYDSNGRIIAFQIRLRDAENGRYRWLTSSTKKNPHGAGPQLPNGELPLAVYVPPTLARPGEAWLPEGTGPKPALTAARLGVIAIGAAGGQHAGSPEQLLTTLKQHGITQVIDPIDAGAVRNPNVMRQRQAVWGLLQNNGIAVSVAWWGQVDKTHPDIDELANLDSIRLITTGAAQAIADQYCPQQALFSQIKAILAQGNRQTRRAWEPTLSRLKLGQSVQSAPNEYQPGQRLAHWQAAKQQGYKYILDQSGTGTGKSHDAGLLTPETLGVRQLQYVSPQHRNPTTPTLTAANGWDDIEARHAGLQRETKPNGETRLRRRGDFSQPFAVAPNCSRNATIAALREKHINGADTAKQVCGGCYLREKCLNAEGNGFGYLHQKRNGLQQAKIRLHPDSLLPPTEFDYSDIGQIWEEAGESLRATQTRQIRLGDLDATIAHLASNHPDLWQALTHTLTALKRLMDGSEQQGRYGISHADILTAIPQIAGINPATVRAAMEPDLSILDTTEEHGVNLADLPPQLRQKFGDRDTGAADKIRHQVLKQWLPEFLGILQGDRGNLHINHDRLTLTLPDDRHRAAAKAAKFMIALDATLSREDWAQQLGVSPDEIYVCRQAAAATDNLEIIQIPDLGRMGMQRGADQQRRRDALIKHYQKQDPTAKVIDFKKFTGDDWGAWWRDSRGSNDFMGCKTLILVGTPCPNLACLQAEWRILTGTEPTGDDFKEWVNRKIEADILQGIGRLRANLRPGEKLTIVLVSNFPLTIPTTCTESASVTRLAAAKAQQKILAIRDAIKEALVSGEQIADLCKAKIARAIGLTRETVKRLWQSAVILLLETPIAKRPLTPPNPEMVGYGLIALREILENPPPDPVNRLNSFDDILHNWLKPAEMIAVWEALDLNYRAELLQILIQDVTTLATD